jgi:hypothetical protein
MHWQLREKIAGYLLSVDDAIAQEEVTRVYGEPPAGKSRQF